LYPHRDLASARREVAFALARLDPEPMPLLDLCCGPGRHSLRFAEKGFSPVGLDYSAPLLELARARGESLRLVRGDMRALPFSSNAFRSVVNFFTSFGYFLGEMDNVAVVTEIERVLAPGGRFLCDTFGRDHVIARLVREENRSTGASRRRSRCAAAARPRPFAKACAPTRPKS
jgi:ubiquinone/menaquinone biosynthesis C-methylase UbiE